MNCPQMFSILSRRLCWLQRSNIVSLPHTPPGCFLHLGCIPGCFIQRHRMSGWQSPAVLTALLSGLLCSVLLWLSPESLHEKNPKRFGSSLGLESLPHNWDRHIPCTYLEAARHFLVQSLWLFQTQTGTAKNDCYFWGPDVHQTLPPCCLQFL